jgi:hypothetical protein
MKDLREARADRVERAGRALDLRRVLPVGADKTVVPKGKLLLGRGEPADD